MKLKFFSVILILSMFFSFVSGAYASYYDENNGNSENTAYIISSLEDFKMFRDRVNNGTDTEGMFYKLDVDIDLTNENNWEAIGSSSNYFKGHFNGNGHVISVDINKSSIGAEDCIAGLFGVVHSGGSTSIKNLKVVGSVKAQAASSLAYAGGLAVTLEGHGNQGGGIENCTFLGFVSAKSNGASDTFAGGIVSYVNSNGAYIVVKSCDVSVGSIISADNNISGSHYYGTSSAGGIAGYWSDGSLTELKNCVAHALILNASNKGGIIGHAVSSENISNNKYGGADYGIGLLGVNTPGSENAAPSDTGCEYDPAPIKILTTSINNAKVNEQYSFKLLASETRNVTWSVSKGELPSDIKLSSSGVLSGTALTSGDYDFDVTASISEENNDTVSLSLKVTASEQQSSGSGGGGGCNTGITFCWILLLAGVFFDKKLYKVKRLLLTILILSFIVSPCVADEIDVFWLVDRGTPAQLKEALDKGAKFNVKRSISDFDNLDDMDVNGWLCEYNETPLHRAAAYNKNPEVIKFLIEQGLDVNAEGYMGHSVITPLSCAVEKKNVEAIKELLKAGANSSVYISSRIPTPLHFIAVQYKNSPDDVKSMIEAIKNASGDVNVHTELSQEDIADLNKYEEEFAKYKTIFLPRNQWKSDDPTDNIRDFSNATTGNLLATLTPLMYAVLYDNTDVVNILLDVSADANIKSVEGKTALDYANELPDSSALKKSPAFEKLKAATTEKKAEISNPKDENFDRADKLVAEGKIPMYVRDKGKFFFNPDFEYGIVGINAQKVNLRSQPNTKANVVAQLSRSDTGKWPVYLGEWTHPNGEHWVLGEYHKNGLGSGKGTPVWIFGKYADPMTEEMYGIAAEGIAIEEAEKERKYRGDSYVNEDYYTQEQNYNKPKQVYQCLRCRKKFLVHSATELPDRGCYSDTPFLTSPHLWNRLQ